MGDKKSTMEKVLERALEEALKNNQQEMADGLIDDLAEEISERVVDKEGTSEDNPMDGDPPDAIVAVVGERVFHARKYVETENGYFLMSYQSPSLETALKELYGAEFSKGYRAMLFIPTDKLDYMIGIFKED